MVDIVPNGEAVGARRATIHLTSQEIVERLGFESNVLEEETKYDASWGFDVMMPDGKHTCMVWYRKGAAWPGASGTREALEEVFGKEAVEWHG